MRLMIERTKSQIAPLSSRTWEAWFVIGSVSLLAALAVADRFVAWLIGEFPTSSLLWQIRFEYLRPIAVYYDVIELNLGGWSPLGFSTLVTVAGALIVGGALSRHRLARAVSYHLLLGAAVALIVLCYDRGLPIGARAVVGTPSLPYALLGGLLTLMAATLCLRIHAQYAGWNADSSKLLMRLPVEFAGLRSSLESLAIEISEQLNPSRGQLPAVIRQRTTRRR
jgi:hypothetical protein